MVVIPLLNYTYYAPTPTLNYGYYKARRRARILQLGGCSGGLGAEPPALENFVFYFAKIT